MAFSPDGTRIVSGSHDYDHTIQVWDASSGQETLKDNTNITSRVTIPLPDVMETHGENKKLRTSAKRKRPAAKRRSQTDVMKTQEAARKDRELVALTEQDRKGKNWGQQDYYILAAILGFACLYFIVGMVRTGEPKRVFDGYKEGTIDGERVAFDVYRYEKQRGPGGTVIGWLVILGLGDGALWCWERGTYPPYDEVWVSPRNEKGPATKTLAKTPAAAAVKKRMTPDQPALGDPIVNSIGIVLVPIPVGQF